MNSIKKHQAWVNIAVYERFNDGKTLENLLRDKGFEARTFDDKWFRFFLFLRPPQITYRVQVRDNEVDKANEFLPTVANGVLEKAIHCPACGSLSVSYPQMTRKFILPTIVLQLGIIFHVVEHECYCENCHFTWALSGKKVPAASKPQFPL